MDDRDGDNDPNSDAALDPDTDNYRDSGTDEGVDADKPDSVEGSVQLSDEDSEREPPADRDGMEEAEYTAADADPVVRTGFWRLVLAVDVALLGLVIGLLLVGFQGRVELGGALTTLGVAALGYAVYRYRRLRQLVTAEGSESGAETGE